MGKRLDHAQYSEAVAVATYFPLPIFVVMTLRFKNIFW